MKKIILKLMAAGTAGLLVCASAQPAPEANGGTNVPAAESTPAPPDMDAAPEAADAAANTSAPENKPAKDAVVILPGAATSADGSIPSDFAAPAEAVGTNNPDELRLNFRNAPLDMVLNYLSDAAGFIIVLDTPVNGNVSVISSHPMTRDEAVDLLNSVLNKNGYAAIRNGRTLTIVDKNDAKTRDIPVKSGNNPDEIPNNAEIVTQIIPIRFVEARQLVSDLTSFVSPQATVVANEEGNSIVITDTQANIRHLTEIIKAVDESAEAETEIRVFHLKYASPADVASELGSIFPSASGNNTQSPIRFGGGGGPGGFFARMMGGGAGGGATASSTDNDRVKKATQVNAVADERIQAVIVTAPKDLMEQIASMMNDLDVPSTRDQKVYVFHMDNGDPQQAVQVLQTMFQSSSSSRGNSSSSSSQNSALMQRAENNTSTSSTSSSSSGSSYGGAGGSRAGGGNSQF
jgi:general secretion pathway protein D